jgi:hypothetical protein
MAMVLITSWSMFAVVNLAICHYIYQSTSSSDVQSNLLTYPQYSTLTNSSLACHRGSSRYRSIWIRKCVECLSSCVGVRVEAW